MKTGLIMEATNFIAMNCFQLREVMNSFLISVFKIKMVFKLDPDKNLKVVIFL